MIEAKRVSAVFYRTEDGAEPVRAWLKSMAKEDRFKIGVDIKTVEFGWPVGMPHCRPLGNGLHEVRTNLENRTARVLFFIARPHGAGPWLRQENTRNADSGHGPGIGQET